MNKILKIFLALVLTLSMMLEIIPVNIIHADDEISVENGEEYSETASENEENKTEEEVEIPEQTEIEDNAPPVENEDSKEEPAEEADVVEENVEEESANKEVVLNAEAFPETEYVVGDIKVTVAYDAGTVPEGTEVVVSEANPAAIEAVEAEVGEGFVVKGADISFVWNGEKIEPEKYSDKTIKVTLSYAGKENLSGIEFETHHAVEDVNSDGALVYSVEEVEETVPTDIMGIIEVPYEYTWTEVVDNYKEVDVFDDVEVEYEEIVPVYETRDITEERTEYVTKTRQVEKTRTVKVKVAFKLFDPSTWLGYKYVTEKYYVTETYQEPVTVTVVVGTEEYQVGTETVKKTRIERQKVGTEKVKDGTKEIVHTETEIREKEVVVGQTVAFEANEFSSYTISWRTSGWGAQNYSYDINYVDTNGNSLTPSRTPTFTNNYMFLIYDIEGYEYDSCHLGSRTGTSIDPLLRYDNNNYWSDDDCQYYNSGWSDLRNDIYVVYKKKADPTTGGTPQVEIEETWPDEDQPVDRPTFSKSSVSNGDGTNTISLSIKASEKSVEEPVPADVIVVFDVSGSMGENMGSSSRLSQAQTAVNTMANTLLNGENTDVRMALVSFSTGVNVVQNFTNNYTTYSGKVSTLNAAGGTNWEGALYEANHLEMRENAAAFVIFVTDGDPTFRISRGDVSDANLDMWTDSTYEYYRNNKVFGTGYSDDSNRNFNFAVEQVKAIDGANKNFYAIGISNDVTKVQNLTTQGGVDADHAFIASNSSAMQEAFATITESIKAKLGFGDVSINDGITDLTNTEMEMMHQVDPNSFKYYRYGGEGNKYGADEAHKTEWTTREADNCGPASYNESSGTVQWNMGDKFQLEDGVTYIVTFRVWASQDAYDLVANLNNGIKVYAPGQQNSITDKERAQVEEIKAPTATTQGEYALKTNTNEVYATYQRTTKTGDTVVVNTTDPITADYSQGNIATLPLESMKLTVKKEFDDDLTGGSDRETEVILVLHRRNANQTPEAVFEPYAIPQAGGQTTANIVLNESNNWTFELYVAPGVEVNGEVLEHGYDFTITEPAIDYHYDLIEEIINPMVVDGTDTFIGDGFLIDDEAQVAEYKDEALTAVNRVKSGIDIRKILVDDAGIVINSNDEFTITGKLLDAEGNPYTWASGDNVDNSGAYHKFVPDPEGTFDFDDFGYGAKYSRVIYKGHFASTDNIEFTLKPGEFVRFINVPDGCTFEFTESATMPTGYELNSVTAVTQHKVSVGGAWTTEGDVQPVIENNVAKLPEPGIVGNKQYVVNITNKSVHGEFFYIYHSSDNTVEKIYADDDRVTKQKDSTTQKYTYTFNIVNEVKQGEGEVPAYLYGGYYKSYSDQAKKAGSSATQADKDAAIETLAFDNNNWAKDKFTEEGSVAAAPYSGSKATAWKKVDAYKVKGTEMHPTANTVYYLKEVPNSYLRPFIQVVYDEYDNNTLKKVYTITALDDANYTKGGFYDGADDSSSSKLSSTVKITKNGSTAYTLTAKGVFNGKKYPDEDNGVEVPRGYLISIDTDFTNEFAMQPFFMTLDGVKVYGVTNRTVDPGNGRFVLDESSQMGIKPGITVEDETNVLPAE